MPRKKVVKRIRPNWTIHPNIIAIVVAYADRTDAISVSNAIEQLLRSHPAITGVQQPAITQ
jgi:hypothetical protein